MFESTAAQGEGGRIADRAADGWSSANELEELVDALAVELGRPVGIDDQRHRVVAYSPHEDGRDDARAAAILRRRASEEAIQWFERRGVRQATTAVRTPANPSLGLARRICIPLRHADVAVGYLWIIDEPAMGDEQLARVLARARRTADLLHRNQLLRRHGRAQEETLLRAVAREPRESARRAADELVSGELLEPASAYAVLVLRATDAAASDRDAGEDVGGQLADSLERLRRTLAPRGVVTAMVGRDGIAVLACSAADDARRRGEALHALAQEMRCGSEFERVVVGIREVRSLVDLPQACEQARTAASVATRVRDAGDVLRWEELGSYATIAQARQAAHPADAIPECMARLLRLPDASWLVETLEVYLEAATDVTATASQLHIHRSSLYHRLRRIEAITAMDLRRGDDRLSLHLGLRLWRMAGSPALDGRGHAHICRPSATAACDTCAMETPAGGPSLDAARRQPVVPGRTEETST
ncbi:MAG TPA: helix-turn-helix domain-containing protein [Conexibacter sp.]|nr:helix-turn-helix domain-containing protein [Conexibacter sp.]